MKISFLGDVWGYLGTLRCVLGKRMESPNRRSYLTGEVLAGVPTLGLLLLFRNGVDVNQFFLIWCGLLAVFILFRSIFKRNRGLFHSSLRSGEMGALLLSHGGVLCGIHAHMNRLLALSLLAGVMGVFILGRSLAKNIGTKTQFLRL